MATAEKDANTEVELHRLGKRVGNAEDAVEENASIHAHMVTQHFVIYARGSIRTWV
jgi:hypothetical protein